MLNQSIKPRWVLSLAALVIATVVMARPCAASVTLNFSGLGNGEGIETYFAGGYGQWGAVGGPENDFGIVFSDGAYSYISVQNGGSIATNSELIADNGNGVSSVAVGVACLTNGVYIDVLGGFKMPLTFWYASFEDDATVNVYSQQGGALGNVGVDPIVSQLLTPTYQSYDELAEDNYLLSRWKKVELDFTGTAMSLQFDGPAIMIVFDQFTVNLADSSSPSGQPVPEASTAMVWSTFGLLGALFCGKKRRRALSSS